LDFKEFLLCRKRYWIIEIVYAVISIIFIFAVRSYNKELNELIMSDETLSDIQKAFNVLSYGDNDTLKYFGFGFLLIFLGIIFCVYLFFRSKSEWEFKEESYIFSFVCSCINFVLIIGLLVALSNPILWAIFIVTIVGSVFMVGLSS